MNDMDYMSTGSGQKYGKGNVIINTADETKNGMGGVKCKKINSPTPVTVTPAAGQAIVAITCCGETVITAAISATGYEIEDLPDTYSIGIELVPRLSSVTLSGFALVYMGR